MHTRRIVIAAFCALLLLVPVTARAHEGHTHKVMGTVESVQLPHIVVKTTDGKSVTVMLDQKTTVLRGKEKLDAAALKAGDRVSIDAMQDKTMMMAKTIKLGTAAPAAKKAN